MASRNKKLRDKNKDHEDIFAFLDEYGVVDKDQKFPKDHQVNKNGPIKKTSSKRRNFRSIDLHGLHADDAERVLKNYIAQWHEMGVKEVRVIHGYGRHLCPDQEPVLKKMVLDLCQYQWSSFIRSFRPGKPKEGGMGVTVLYLK